MRAARVAFLILFFFSAFCSGEERNKSLVIAHSAVWVANWAITEVGISKGYEEANPIMRIGPAKRGAITAGVVLGGILADRYLQPQVAKAILIPSIGVTSGMFIWNVTVLW